MAGIQALLIMVLAGALGISALACPLWTGSVSKAEPPPCSNHDDSSEQCPVLICQASAPYFVDRHSDYVPLFQELTAEIVSSAINPISFGSSSAGYWDDESPPGAAVPLFLRTHAFLI